MAAAALLRSKTTPSRSSNQSWLPILVDPQKMIRGALFVSEQSSLIGLTWPQQHHQTDTQMQSASPLDQSQGPQGGLAQYQPTGKNREPPTTDAFPPTGNNETPIAGDDLNSDAVVNDQLTHLISRDDQAQGQSASSNQDAFMPDASTVHDIVAPRRTIGGRCRKWCISTQPASGKCKRVACVLCGYDVLVVKRVSNSGAIVIVPTEVSVMTMNCSQSKLQIRMWLVRSHADGMPSPEPRQTQKYFAFRSESGSSLNSSAT